MLVKSVEILECNLPTAPQEFDNNGRFSPLSLAIKWTNQNQKQPLDIRIIGYLECRFSGLDLAQFSHRRIGTRMVYDLDIEVEVSFTAMNRKLRFVARALRQELGQTELTTTLG